MAKPVITGVTLSLEFGDTEYGKGSKSFMNIQSRYPDGTENLDEVASDGLDLYFTIFKTLIASRYASGLLEPAEFKTLLADTATRVDRVRKHIVKVNNEQQQ